MSDANTRGSGLLFILVGPGGVGKNAMMQGVLGTLPNLRQLPTATTRAPRPGETHGKERFFVTMDQFTQMIAEDQLIEHEEVHPGKFYGVPRQPVEAAIAAGEDLVADVEMSGAQKVYTAYPENTVLIFVAPPSRETLEARMRARGEAEAGIQERMDRYEREMAFQPQTHHLIINDELQSATDALRDYIRSRQADRQVPPHSQARPPLHRQPLSRSEA